MIGSREDLHLELQDILETYGAGNRKDVYFQPPESIKMDYPAITYELSGVTDKKANNSEYFIAKEYAVTFMTNDPDLGNNLIEIFLERFKFCRFSRSFISQNLNHYIFNLFY